MIKSLRWRLQIWHAAILGVAIALFGSAFYAQLHRSTYGEIDLELLSGARVLEGALRALPPHMRDGERLFTLPPRLGESRPGEGRGRAQDGRNGRPGPRPNGPGGDGRPGPPSPQQHMQNTLQLPPFFPRGPREAPPYFAVFNPEGDLMDAEPREGAPTWVAVSRSITYRSSGRNREVLLRGPGDTLIVVGRDIHMLVDRMRASLVQLIVTGIGVLGLGLIGGWWLSGKTIQPIKQISDTAGKINAASLSERIDSSGMDDEVRTLATILNSMFGRLDSSFKQQSQFTADASHELRTPLAVLMSHCELALSRPRGADEYKQTIYTCQKAGARMKTLVEDLLTLARADVGKLEIERTPVDLHAAAGEAIALIHPLAQQHEVEVTLHGPSVTCMGDARRLSQVFANLLSNAVHYNKPGGKVSVTTELDGEHAVVEVRDTGCGIPASALPHLFDRFFRVDEARSRQTGGSGLGLAICKSIVDAHEGSISVESDLGNGSIFRMRLPSMAKQADGT